MRICRVVYKAFVLYDGMGSARQLLHQKVPLFFSSPGWQPTILNNSSTTAATNRRCLNIPSIIAPTSAIITTPLMYTIALSMTGLNS